MEKEKKPVAENLLKPAKKPQTTLRVAFPKKNSFFPFLFLILLVLVIILIGAVRFRGLFRQKPVPAPIEDVPSGTRNPADEYKTRYYEGVRFYEQSESGSGKLLVIEGKVVEVNLLSRFIVIENYDLKESISYTPEDDFQQIVLLKDPKGGLPFEYQPIAPDKISVGDRIAHHPAGISPDNVNHWIVQKPVQ